MKVLDNIFANFPQGKYPCKCSHVRWGKISQKCWEDLSRRGNSHDTTPISFIKSYWFNYRAGEISAKKTISQKTRKSQQGKITMPVTVFHTCSNPCPHLSSDRGRRRWHWTHHFLPLSVFPRRPRLTTHWTTCPCSLPISEESCVFVAL